MYEEKGMCMKHYTIKSTDNIPITGQVNFSRLSPPHLRN